MKSNSLCSIVYVTCCVDSTSIEIEKYMKNSRKASYKRLISLIKKHCPEIFQTLCLDFYNPWEGQTYQTKTHYILTHSGIEYIFIKEFKY